MINYDDALDQLRAFGLVWRDRDLIIDGRVHRCWTVDDHREKRAWYILDEWRAPNGNSYLTGSFGIFRGNSNDRGRIVFSTGDRLSAADRDAMRKRHQEQKRLAAAARQREIDRAARRAAAVWGKSHTTPPPGVAVDYLDRKQIKSWGLRYTDTGALVVPMMDANREVQGLQFILPSHHPRRRKTGRDKEYWPPGMGKQGRWFLIGSARAAGICLVCEGYATGATLHEATGLPVAIAFDAGNLVHVASAIKKAYRLQMILICADDDFLTDGNPGCAAAAAAALAVGGAWVAPEFPADRGGKKLTDYNDLQHFPGGGLPLVARQIEAKLVALGWQTQSVRGARTQTGVGEDGQMVSRLTIEEAVARYWGTYGLGGEVLFDAVERRLIHKRDVVNLLPRHGWETLRDHPGWRVARDTEIGFDPTEKEPGIRCNLFGGWPTEPREGKCTALLDLLEYMCGNETTRADVFAWILKWLAYPLQHRGAKMHSAIVLHGPQGTGKSRFFEAYAQIFGPYARVLGQEALEDKFNADWAEKKLFIVGDEVLARGDMYHIKNRLKGFITGHTIRVNPKNIAAHNERNQMNIVFLSNERMPLVLENDDRRHLVIFTPPKLDDRFFADVNAEIESGGVAALHHYLLELDLGDFKPWTKPPMTSAKQDLIELGMSSEDRFIREWIALEVDGRDGEPLPFVPCMGSQLYSAYERWCESHGERKRGAKELISLANKLPGWRAGVSTPTYVSLTDRTTKNRKMVIPSAAAVADAVRHCRTGEQAKLLRDRFESQAEWLTACFFAFDMALAAGA